MGTTESDAGVLLTAKLVAAARFRAIEHVNAQLCLGQVVTSRHGSHATLSWPPLPTETLYCLRSAHPGVICDNGSRVGRHSDISASQIAKAASTRNTVSNPPLSACNQPTRGKAAAPAQRPARYLSARSEEHTSELQ